MLFDVGNLITIGIVILLFILSRLLDKSKGSLDKVRKYMDRSKDEMSAFIDEKGAVIKNYGIALDVEKKAAAELMRRIQILTREELSQKVQALAQIDERIRIYDASLEELVQMTGRVQENLSRIRDESEFVESVGKRVSDVKDKVERSVAEINTINEQLVTMEQRFEEENTAALDKAIKIAVSSAHLSLLDFEAQAQAIEQKIENHREVVEKLERTRMEKLAQDEERIEKLLVEAVDRAGSRADKVEEAALTKLREQAQSRVNTLKANFEDKMKALQNSLAITIGDMQTQVKANEDQQKAYSIEWKRDMQDLIAYAQQFKETWNKDIAEFAALSKGQTEELSGALTAQRDEWKTMVRDTGQDIISSTQQQLDEYRLSQDEQFNQLSGFIKDSSKLEAELRLYMQEVLNRVNSDFNRYGDEIRGNWESVAGDFNARLTSIWEELTSINLEISGIKEKSFLNDSTKLEGFEDEFLANLSGRSANIDSQLEAWQEGHDKKLETMTEDSDAKRLAAEYRIAEETKKIIATQDEKIVSDMERLKAETIAFQESIRKEMHGTDESLRELDSSMDEVRRRNRDLVSENSQQIAAVRTSMDEIRKDIAAQTKLIERTDTLKAELDRHIKGMDSNIERISQLKNETARMESHLADIKRLEDDVNAKLARFLSEKHRIEVIETDFNRLLQTSQAVEQKLTQVSNSEDKLQSMQVQLRRFDELMKETEEKFQRVERKDTILQEINDGIDRNFRALQEDEQSIKQLDEILTTLKVEVENIQNAVNTLSTENEKTRDAAEKLATLDDSVNILEKRIAEMNSARESQARLATELQNLEKDGHSLLKLIRSTLDREDAKFSGRQGKSDDKGKLSPEVREHIYKLSREQRWASKEIAQALGLSISEVDLVLELGQKDL